MLGQCLSNGRNDILVGVPYASSDEFTEFLLIICAYLLDKKDCKPDLRLFLTGAYY